MKRIALFIAMTIEILSLTSCTKEEVDINFVGNWKVVKFDYNKDNSTISHIEYNNPDERILTFNNDGTGMDDEKLWGESVSVSFTWDFIDGKLTMRAADAPYDNLPLEVRSKANEVYLYYNSFPKDEDKGKDIITVEPGSGYYTPQGISCSITIKKLEN